MNWWWLTISHYYNHIRATKTVGAFWLWNCYYTIFINCHRSNRIGKNVLRNERETKAHWTNFNIYWIINIRLDTWFNYVRWKKLFRYSWKIYRFQYCDAYYCLLRFVEFHWKQKMNYSETVTLQEKNEFEYPSILFDSYIKLNSW